MFALRFLNKDTFDNYDDYKENAVPNVPENFNFAYDVIDEIAKVSPDKVAIIWTDDSGETKTFTFFFFVSFMHSIICCALYEQFPTINLGEAQALLIKP